MSSAGSWNSLAGKGKRLQMANGLLWSLAAEIGSAGSKEAFLWYFYGRNLAFGTISFRKYIFMRFYMGFQFKLQRFAIAFRLLNSIKEKWMYF